MKHQKITIVGAGPGDVDLITLKGLNAIKSADVILYDALVNEELLSYAPAAKHIFVGKRKGYKTYEQEEINQLMVDCAVKYGAVVRLKGGDPFVFGRGGEELDYALREGIVTEVIPGVSSAIGVPAVAGYSITYRKISTNFSVVSGTLSDGSYNPSIDQMAHLDGTLIILMGLGQLEKIAGAFERAGKSHMDAAVIINGTLPTEQVIEAPVSGLEKAYKEAGLIGPGIILIGEIVKKRTAHTKNKEQAQWVQ